MAGGQETDNIGTWCLVDSLNDCLGTGGRVLYPLCLLSDDEPFRERFKSEPVNDIAYFVTLLRYIHQNPVKAGMVAEVKDYEFSSWDETLIRIVRYSLYNNCLQI